MPLAIPSTNNLPLVGQKTYDILIQSFNRSASEPVTVERIHRWFDSLKNRGYRPASLHCVKAALKKSLTLLGDDSDRFRSDLDSTFRKIKCGRPDSSGRPERVLTETESAKLERSMPKRLSLVWETLCATGLRISELTGIRLTDLTVENGSYLVNVIGKGYKQRRVFLSHSLVERITSEFRGRTYLFETIGGGRYCRKYLWREIRKHGRKTLERSVSCHSARSTFATVQAVQKKRSLKALAQYLGHSNITITSRYVSDHLRYEDIFQEVV